MLAIWQNMWRKEIYSPEPTKEVHTWNRHTVLKHQQASSFYFPSLVNRPHHQMLGASHSFMHILPWRHTPSLSFSFHKYKYFYNQMKTVQQQNSIANICYNFNTIFKRCHFIYQKLDAIKDKGLLLTTDVNSNIQEHKSYTSTENQKSLEHDSQYKSNMFMNISSLSPWIAKLGTSMSK